jgi:hypothetical protein
MVVHVLAVAVHQISIRRKQMSSKLNKMSKVSESFTVNRYDNGWMVEIGGRDKKEDWKTSKILCNTEEELLALIREYNTMDLDN